MTKAITKNSKKGFTLVELVVVIAILAILAAIAIPVVNSIINTASRNGAISNADTIELSVKECQADIAAKNDEVYDGTTDNTVDGSGDPVPAASTNHGDIDITDVASVKAIPEAFATVTYNGVDYAPYWDTVNDKCVFLSITGSQLGFEISTDLDAAGAAAYTGFTSVGATTGDVVALTAATESDSSNSTLLTSALIDSL